ncbi:hypothetical protein PR048_007920 [Dryococelus australis]|uniref:Uncharacterized protein n=1 Tax=Dryococelus australis TaxID=614101 RepID=A0ABQ9HWJ5_9NEOP|nr:hypothetical protein PR048_007920 [Dryococelus australis]
MLPRTNTSGPTPKAVKHKSTYVLNYLSSRFRLYREVFCAFAPKKKASGGCARVNELPRSARARSPRCSLVAMTSRGGGGRMSGRAFRRKPGAASAGWPPTPTSRLFPASTAAWGANTLQRRGGGGRRALAYYGCSWRVQSPDGVNFGHAALSSPPPPPFLLPHMTKSAARHCDGGGGQKEELLEGYIGRGKGEKGTPQDDRRMHAPLGGYARQPRMLVCSPANTPLPLPPLQSVGIPTAPDAIGQVEQFLICSCNKQAKWLHRLATRGSPAIKERFAARSGQSDTRASAADRGLVSCDGATVAERLARSPLTKANRAQSPAGSPDFRKWECICRRIFSGIPRFNHPSIPAPLHINF